MKSATSQLWLLAATTVTGAVYTFGYVLLSGLFPPISPALSAVEVAQFYADHRDMMRWGVMLCLIGGGFNIPWAIVIAAHMARLEKGPPLWALLQLIGAAMNTVVIVLPALIWGTISFREGHEPDTVAMFSDFAFLAFITPVSWVWMQALPVAIVSLGNRDHGPSSAFPRWVGWLSLVVVLTTMHGVAGLLTHSGAFAWNGLFTFWLPVAVSGLWVSALYITLGRAIRAEG